MAALEVKTENSSDESLFPDEKPKAHNRNNPAIPDLSSENLHFDVKYHVASHKLVAIRYWLHIWYNFKWNSDTLHFFGYGICP